MIDELTQLPGPYVPQLGLAFESKDKGTNWLKISHEVGDEATEALIEDLCAIGWERPDSRFRQAPPIQNVAETSISKKGEGLFGCWTPEECKQNMKEARAVLKRHGYTHVPVHQLTWQDLC